MATKSPKKAKIPAKIMDALVDALALHNNIEMANIPSDCVNSAAASWLCVNRKQTEWVQMHINSKAQDFKYNLRPGHESSETDS